MANYAEYFERKSAELPKPKFNSGDRVFGRWNKIPFIGSVVRNQDKIVLVHLDLPLKHNNVIHNVLRLAQMDVTLLKTME
jgi:hypothetical protein